MKKSPAPMVSTTLTSSAGAAAVSPEADRAVQPLGPRLTTDSRVCLSKYVWAASTWASCEAVHVRRAGQGSVLELYHEERLSPLEALAAWGVIPHLPVAPAEAPGPARRPRAHWRRQCRGTWTRGGRSGWPCSCAQAEGRPTGKHNGFGGARFPPEMSYPGRARINHAPVHARTSECAALCPCQVPHTHLEAGKVHGNQGTRRPGHAHHLPGKLWAVQAVPLAVQQAQSVAPVRGYLHMR